MATTTIARWGNSLGIRIPKDAAERADLHEGDVVRVLAEGGHLLVLREHDRSIEQLIEMITPENVHAETFETPIGAEVW